MPRSRPLTTAQGAPRARRIDDMARQEVAALLGEASRERSYLIEHLHRIQDQVGHLSHAHLAALAERMALPLAEVFETASFYAHFVLVPDGETPPSRIVRVCGGPACRMAGPPMGEPEPDTLVIDAPCMGRCDRAPAVLAEETNLAPAELGAFPIYEECRAGRRSVDQVLAEIDAAGLRGLGGAGFPTARKWRAVREHLGPRVLVVNADEGEPGTFKDRHILETALPQFLEGVLIAAWAIAAERIVIYIRDEYPALRRRLRHALAMLGDGRIELRRGAGAYVCGEETALLESIEGKRGLPRLRPPYPVEAGLFGRPTVINNVETLFWIPEILRHGGDAFAAQGVNGAKGLRLYSLSGRVNRPGVKRAPAGITLDALIAEHGGGMIDGHRLAAFLAGGASGGFLPPALASTPLDFGKLEPHGSFLGSAAIVVFSQVDDLLAHARALMRFFAHESCGQCTPCRVGTAKAAELLDRPRWDKTLLGELADAMRDASICGLGQAAPNVFLSLLRHFPELTP